MTFALLKVSYSAVTVTVTVAVTMTSQKRLAISFCSAGEFSAVNKSTSKMCITVFGSSQTRITK